MRLVWLYDLGERIYSTWEPRRFSKRENVMFVKAQLYLLKHISYNMRNLINLLKLHYLFTIFPSYQHS